MAGTPWTRDELIVVLKLYCVTPFGKIHARNPELKRLAAALGRTPSSITLKMTNFASLDPTIRQSGMSNYSKLDKIVWNDFFTNMDLYVNASDVRKSENEFSEDQTEYVGPDKIGSDVMRMVKTRVNQDFFRTMVMASYENKCALTGIDAPELLIASHIVPWSIDASARTNPRNGICLNAIHDRAFDCGLMTFDDDFSVIYSNELPRTAREALREFGHNRLQLPTRFIPDKTFLEWHRTTRFQH
jgi:putative restriction endonuclease